MILERFMLAVFIFTSLSLPPSLSYIVLPLYKSNNLDGNPTISYHEGFTSNIPLKNYKNIQYYTEISVGAPPQTFNIMLDTSSNLFWVPGRLNKGSCGNGHTRFNELASYSYVDLNDVSTIKFNGQLTQAHLIKETVTIGTFVVTNQTMGLLIDGDCDGLQYDGIMGLGLWNDQEFNVIQSMMAQNQLTSQIISLFFHRKAPEEKEQTGGELYIAGWNTNLIENTDEISFISTITAYPETLWIILISQVEMNDKYRTSLLVGSGRALVSTGTSFILVPEVIVKKLMSTMKAYLSGGTYYVDCTRIFELPSITFTINKKEYTLEGNDYVLKEVRKEGYCAVGIGVIESYSPYDWVLGDVFLSKYYTIFNYRERSIAFAPLRSGSERITYPLLCLIILIFMIVLKP